MSKGPLEWAKWLRENAAQLTRGTPVDPATSHKLDQESGRFNRGRGDPPGVGTTGPLPQLR